MHRSSQTEVGTRVCCLSFAAAPSYASLCPLVCAVLFQALFNILWEESVDCRLVTIKGTQDKMLNWNRINAVICFNYLQQEFYLVEPTMRSLAQGKSQKAILKLLRVMISVSQSNFGDLNLDDGCIRDIADVITADVGVAEETGNQSAAAMGESLNLQSTGGFQGSQAAAHYAGEEIK